MTLAKLPPMAAAAILLAHLAFLAAFPVAAQTFETRAEQAFLMDAESGAVLFSKNADDLMVPASMAKIMTVEVIADEIRRGRINDETEFLISENAWRNGGAPSRGSTMFAEVGSSIALPDLLRGIIVHSGNDASIAAAETIAGSEGAFARMMTQRARELGLQRSSFTNSTGFHDPYQKTTARELALLTLHLIETSPEIYAIFAEQEFTWNNIRQRNRNPLLEMNIGADGVKTGFVSESGYGLVGSAVQLDQRLILVVNGFDSARDRATEARRLLEWGFRSFEPRLLFNAGETIGHARVFGGESNYVPLVARGAVRVMLPRGTNERLSAAIVYHGPLRTPVREGDEIAVLRVMRGDTLALEAPLFALESVAEGSLPQRALDSLWELGSGAIRRAIFGSES
ncbi:MAG: D-alanyl-D-alanine carboxypeptidase [Salinarimonadaceae bacterium]|nr:MAG: D-alanyl-D-alanine carboxypeptidase [Salinarimonadaceae bacterium]